MHNRCWFEQSLPTTRRERVRIAVVSCGSSLHLSLSILTLSKNSLAIFELTLLKVRDDTGRVRYAGSAEPSPSISMGSSSIIHAAPLITDETNALSASGELSRLRLTLTPLEGRRSAGTSTCIPMSRLPACRALWPFPNASPPSTTICR